MKNRVKLFRWMSALLLGAAVLTSCSHEDMVGGGTVPGDDGETVFTVTVPLPAAIQTRGVTEKSTEDNALHDLTFLLFSTDASQTYTGYAIASAIVKQTIAGDNQNRYTVRVKLPDGAHNALVVANWGRFQGGSLSAYMATVVTPQLTDKTLAEVVTDDFFRYDGFPDSGDFTAAHPFFLIGSNAYAIPANHATSRLDLTRSLAKINVTVDDDAGFALKSIRLMNARTQAQLFPSLTPDALNLPTGTATIGETGITYTVPSAKSTAFLDEIFLPETPVPAALVESNPTTWADAVALLIEADLGGGDIRWFRLNLRVKDETTNKLKHVDIRRNHRYTVRIIGIAGSQPGYDTPGEAIDALPGDLIIDMKVDDDELNNIVYNGRYYLAAGNLEIFDSKDWGPGFVGLTQDLKIETNYPGGWTIDMSDSESWLSSVTPDASTAAGSSTATVVVEANTTPQRETTFDIVGGDGSLRLPVTVVQKPRPTIHAGNVVFEYLGGTISNHPVRYDEPAGNWQVESITYQGAGGWLQSVERVEGTSTLKIVVTSTYDTYASPRIAQVKLKDAFTGAEHTFTVTQKAKDEVGWGIAVGNTGFFQTQRITFYGTSGGIFTLGGLRFNCPNDVDWRIILDPSIEMFNTNDSGHFTFGRTQGTGSVQTSSDLPIYAKPYAPITPGYGIVCYYVIEFTYKGKVVFRGTLSIQQRP